MKYKYLFSDPHNGYYASYTPFTTDKPLSQEDATKFILIHNPAARRFGSNLEDLKIVADDHGYNLIPYHCTYVKPDEASRWLKDYDPLPSDFTDWEVIEGISGNY